MDGGVDRLVDLVAWVDVLALIPLSNHLTPLSFPTVTKAMTSPTAAKPPAVNEEQRKKPAVNAEQEKKTNKDEPQEEDDSKLTEDDRAADRLQILTALEDSFPNALDAQQLSRYGDAVYQSGL